MRDVVLITVDSLRADHVGWHGYDRDTTPRLDAIAADAHTFANAFANGCGTNRSFPSILTSTYPLMYGGYEFVSPDRTLVSQVFDEADYHTGGFHSNPWLLSQFGYGRGYDRYYEFKEDASATARLRQAVKDHLDESGLLFRTLKRAFDAGEKRAGFNPGKPSVDADDITDQAIEWLAGLDGDAPRFLWVHYMDVHHPYQPPAEHQRPFTEDPVGDRRSVKLRRKMLERPADVSESELQELVDLYDGTVRFVDHEVGRLVDAVREAWDDPLVAFTSDHGDELKDHGAFSHYNTYYDEVLHVPLLLDAGDAGGSHDELVELLDLAPTLLDLAGLAAPETYLGRSLRPLVEGGEWEKDGVIAETAGSRAYRTDRWKYIDNDEGSRLYDLREDPGESRDVASSHPEVVEEIEGVLADHADRIAETDRDVETVDIDEQTRDRLQQLGYVD